MQKKTVDNLSVAFFLLLVLLFPKTAEFTRFYFALILVAAPVLLITKKGLHFDWLVLIGIGVLIVTTISTVLRFFFITDPNLRDYTEIARLFLPVLMLIFRDKFKNLSVKTIFIILAIYCSIDFLISVLNFAGKDLMGIVSFSRSYYVSDYHAVNLGRICGLSSGPGQHGIMMLVLFIFFYNRVFQARKIIFPMMFAFLSIIPLFLTQSRTSIVIFLLVSITVPFFYLLRGKDTQKKRTIPVLVLLLGGGGYLFYKFMGYFDRVLQLLGDIEKITSLQARQETYANLFNKAMEKPAFLTLGYGKEFFKTGVFDNEYLMLFLVHGPFIAILVFGGVTAFVFRTVLKRDIHKYPFRIILFFLFLFGLLLAFPLQFFLKASLMPLLVTFMNLSYWENKENKITEAAIP